MTGLSVMVHRPDLSVVVAAESLVLNLLHIVIHVMGQQHMFVPVTRIYMVREILLTLCVQILV